MKYILSLAVALAFAISAQATEDKKRFVEADGDQDGLVSQEEASAVGISEAKFKKIDKNQDGKLSRDEYREAHRAEKSDSSDSGGY